MKPIVTEYYKNQWEFIFPPNIDNQKVKDKFWYAVELLDFDDSQAEKIFKTLIKKYPYYLDAYNHLSIAFRNQKKEFESYIAAEKSYILGKECLPKEFDIKKDKLIWSNLDNRQFLRACHVYALECQANKEYYKAIELCDEILSLNEDDHQGIRYLKLECLFALKDYSAVRQLLSKYEDNWSIDFAYGLVALEVFEDNYNMANQNLIHARKVNTFFPDEVKKIKHKKPVLELIPGERFRNIGITLGSVHEAYYYWSRNKAIYKQQKIIDFYNNQ